MHEKVIGVISTVCSLLGKHDVQYMFVDGVAVGLHGYFRHSVDSLGNVTTKPDIDIWYNPSYPNYFNLLKVIAELGYDTSSFWQEQTPNPNKSFFKLDFTDYSLDFLPFIKLPIKFHLAYGRKEEIETEFGKIFVLNYVDLIEDKKALGRRKDFEDIKELKKSTNNSKHKAPK